MGNILSIWIQIFFLKMNLNILVENMNKTSSNILYSGRTKCSASVSKLGNISEEYICLRKTQKSPGFFIQKISGWRMI
jgi:hypothetical protein